LFRNLQCIVTIRTFLIYLQQDLQKTDTKRVAEDIGYMTNASNNMSRMLDELLEFSRLGRLLAKGEVKLARDCERSRDTGCGCHCTEWGGDSRGIGCAARWVWCVPVFEVGATNYCDGNGLEDKSLWFLGRKSGGVRSFV
jgi:hypothetical protein